MRELDYQNWHSLISQTFGNICYALRAESQGQVCAVSFLTQLEIKPELKGRRGEEGRGGKGRRGEERRRRETGGSQV